jgi:hypothetical protein
LLRNHLICATYVRRSRLSRSPRAQQAVKPQCKLVHRKYTEIDCGSKKLRKRAAVVRSYGSEGCAAKKKRALFAAQPFNLARQAVKRAE